MAFIAIETGEISFSGCRISKYGEIRLDVILRLCKLPILFVGNSCLYMKPDLISKIEHS